MNKIKVLIITLLAICFTIKTSAQVSWMTTFEPKDLGGTDTFWNGSDGSGVFTNADARFINNYDSAWKFWSGFSISSKRDKTTPGFKNEFASITGNGVNYSNQYAVISSAAQIKLENPQIISGCYVTNSTYAALSMKNGDAFAKKFGGDSGKDKDYFMLTVTGFNGTTTKITQLFLADFRSDNNAEDFILYDWKYLDLSMLGKVDSIHFTLSSSDTGQWGMNTPAYFCMDNFNAPNPNQKNSFKLTDFNNWSTAKDTFDKGESGNGGFKVNDYFFTNSYNLAWNTWSGFALSNMFDTTTSDYTNEFSSISGQDTGNKYLVGYGRASIYLPYDNQRFLINSNADVVLKVSNSTYAYRTMENGNQFAKKFGGASGMDKDFLVLKIAAIDYNGKTTDTFSHYLADFRSSNPANHFIQKSWEDVYLTRLFTDFTPVRFDFWLEGSDTGQYGLNTPAYFCLDNVFEFIQGWGVEQEIIGNVNIFPNPASSYIKVNTNAQPSDYQILNLNGQQILNGEFQQNIDVESIQSGVYILHLNTDQGILRSKFIKQ